MNLVRDINLYGKRNKVLTVLLLKDDIDHAVSSVYEYE